MYGITKIPLSNEIGVDLRTLRIAFDETTKTVQFLDGLYEDIQKTIEDDCNCQILVLSCGDITLGKFAIRAMGVKQDDKELFLIIEQKN